MPESFETTTQSVLKQAAVIQSIQSVKRLYTRRKNAYMMKKSLMQNARIIILHIAAIHQSENCYLNTI